MEKGKNKKTKARVHIIQFNHVNEGDEWWDEQNWSNEIIELDNEHKKALHQLSGPVESCVFELFFGKIHMVLKSAKEII